MAKKTKKIETPIDQRETFVSIQKSFADSDLSVEEKLKTLYELQQADTAIDKILQLRGELPLEVESLENEISELKGKSANISAQIEELNAKIAESKHNIVECESQLEKYRSQLDNVANSREYDSLNKEIENQDLLKAIAQKNIDESRTDTSSSPSLAAMAPLTPAGTLSAVVCAAYTAIPAETALMTAAPTESSGEIFFRPEKIRG